MVAWDGRQAAWLGKVGRKAWRAAANLGEQRVQRRLPDGQCVPPLLDPARFNPEGRCMFGQPVGLTDMPEAVDGKPVVFANEEDRHLHQRVAHAAADQISLVTGALQAFDNVHRVTAELRLLQRMLAAVKHFRRAADVLRNTLGRTE